MAGDVNGNVPQAANGAATGFIQRELDRLSVALCEAPQSERYAELYAAQQALAWALEPTGFASPFAYLTGIREGSGKLSGGTLISLAGTCRLRPTPQLEALVRKNHVRLTLLSAVAKLLRIRFKVDGLPYGARLPIAPGESASAIR